MLIKCPTCGHSGEVDDNIIPEGKVKATCPSCKNVFHFSKPSAQESVAQPDDAADFLASLKKEAAKGVHQDAAPQFVPPTAPSAKDTKPETSNLLEHSLTFHGKGADLFILFLKNAFLSIITLNIYYFWGKTKIRQYIYGQMELLGERFNYLGTGRELFNGAFKAGGLLFLFIGLPNILSEFVHPAFGVLVFVGIYLLRPFVQVSARRYRYSRTEWHGVRFSFRGTIKEGMKLIIPGSILSIITLGFYYPSYYIKKQAFFREKTFFGTAAFKYTGNSKDVSRHIIVGLYLCIVTLGLYWFWYKAHLMRYDWEHTSIQSVKFGSNITGGKLFSYHLGNAALIIFTLGIGYAWFVKRKTEFWTKYVHLTGKFDFETILQNKDNSKASGDDLADALDVDFAF